MTTALLILLLTNSVRHTPLPLIIDPNLETRAQHRAEELCVSQQWSHAGYAEQFKDTAYTFVGENLARGYPSVLAAFNGWVHSPTHLANLQNPIFHTIGVGYDPRCNIYVELFGGI